MSAAAASSASPARSRPVATAVFDATSIAEPAVNSEREPALPKSGAAIGVALHDADLFDRHAEDVDDQLRIGGRDALPHRHGRSIDLDLAVAGDGDGDALLERIAAGPFQERGEAAPAQLSARAGLGLARGEIVPFGDREALVEHLLEFSGIVNLPHRAGVGHLLRRDQIAAADLDRVHAELSRRGVEQALDQIDRLGTAGAAIGGGRGGVGQHRVELQVDRPDVVDAGGDPGADQHLNDDAGRSGVGAHVGERAHAIGEHLAVRVEREFGAALDIAALGRGEEFLDAFGGPSHRALQGARGEGDDDVLGIKPRLHAEPAADVVDDDADLGLRECRGCHCRACRARPRASGWRGAGSGDRWRRRRSASAPRGSIGVGASR